MELFGANRYLFFCTGTLDTFERVDLSPEIGIEYRLNDGTINFFPHQPNERRAILISPHSLKPNPRQLDDKFFVGHLETEEVLQGLEQASGLTALVDTETEVYYRSVGKGHIVPIRLYDGEPPSP